MKDEASPDQPGVAEHHREQPDNALDAGLVSKFDHELGKVDLRLLAGRRLKANLEASRSRRSKIAQKVGDRGVSALISALLELAPQAAACQGRERDEPLAQIRYERINQMPPRRPRRIARRPLGLWRCACRFAAPPSSAGPWKAGKHETWGIFQRHFWGVYTRHPHPQRRRILPARDSRLRAKITAGVRQPSARQPRSRKAQALHLQAHENQFADRQFSFAAGRMPEHDARSR